MPNVRGYADASIRFSGPIDAPAFKGSIDIPALIVDGWGPVELASAFRYEYGALLAQVRLADDEGELIETEGSLLVDLVHLVQEPERGGGSPGDLSVADLDAHAPAAVERVPEEAQRAPRSRCGPSAARGQPHARRRRVPNPRRLPFQHRLAVGFFGRPVRKRIQPAGHAQGAAGRRGHRAHHGRRRGERKGARPAGLLGDPARRLVAKRRDPRLAGDPNQRRLLRCAHGEPPLPVPLRRGRPHRAAQGHRSLQRRPEAFVLDGVGRASCAPPRACPPDRDGQHDRRNAAVAKSNLRQRTKTASARWTSTCSGGTGASTTILGEGSPDLGQRAPRPGAGQERRRETAARTSTGCRFRRCSPGWPAWSTSKASFKAA